jgi:anthranilate phosphoribosyltransferase
MTIQEALNDLLAYKDLSSLDMQTVMRSIMSGEASAAQIAGFMVALRMKGETVDEIAAAAQVMRDLSSKVLIDVDTLVDTCGTGGDGSSTFNVSTASALVAASAGVKIAKHGNRSVSSKCGSADVLEALGVKLDLTPEQMSACVQQVGIGFMFAPMYHGSMKHAIAPRKELGVRTIFNLLGPLTNPAGAKRQVLGVFSDEWLEPIAEVLRALSSQHVLVVHAQDGLDEFSITGPTNVCELRDGDITRYQVIPEDMGLERASLDLIKVNDVQESVAMIRALLAGEAGAAADIVALNAGAAIYVAGISTDLSAGVALAKQKLLGGEAATTLQQLVSFSQQ